MNKKFVYREYGTPDVLQVEIESLRVPQKREVLVVNELIGVNPIDWKMISGAFRSQESRPPNGVPGWASVGTVEAVGSEVSHLHIGQKVVVGSRAGGYRERQIVHGRFVVPLPSSLTVEQAAGLPSSAVAGYSIIHQLGITSGDTLMIHGAAGSVGASAAQIAIGRGATVIGSASTHNHEYLRSLGVVPVEYGPEVVNAVKSIAAVSAIADAIGGKEPAEATHQLLGHCSRAVTVWGTKYSQAAGIPGLQHPEDELERVVELASQGMLKVRIAAEYAFDDAVQALKANMTLHSPGKILLRV
ncbi:alcohol dehydrogenase catalytic domain-containing protein [Glutamicibacter sp. TV12E]|uniref:alcohol dehydrogenase catalytic domain-containing protein n=1 Tax=Glutamicibacter sp. TV12E TaxID=3446362 RepID=UPI00403356CB